MELGLRVQADLVPEASSFDLFFDRLLAAVLPRTHKKVFLHLSPGLYFSSEILESIPGHKGVSNCNSERKHENREINEENLTIKRLENRLDLAVFLVIAVLHY